MTRVHPGNALLFPPITLHGFVVTAYVHTYVYVCMHIYTRTHTHTHTHTQTHTHTHTAVTGRSEVFIRQLNSIFFVHGAPSHRQSRGTHPLLLHWNHHLGKVFEALLILAVRRRVEFGFAFLFCVLICHLCLCFASTAAASRLAVPFTLGC